MKEHHNAIPLNNGLFVLAWDINCVLCKNGIKHHAGELKKEDLPLYHLTIT